MLTKAEGRAFAATTPRGVASAAAGHLAAATAPSLSVVLTFSECCVIGITQYAGFSDQLCVLNNVRLRVISAFSRLLGSFLPVANPRVMPRPTSRVSTRLLQGPVGLAVLGDCEQSCCEHSHAGLRVDASRRSSWGDR